MKSLMIKTAMVVLGLAGSAGLAAAMPASGSAATTTTGTSTTVTQPPVQGTTPRLVTMYVDTVQGAGGSPKPAAGCAITNLFEQGQVVVFRMWGTDGADGGLPLTQKNVKSAVVSIPLAGGGSTTLPLAYAAHGSYAYWTTPWNTTKSTALGVVNFTVTVKTLPIPGIRKKIAKHWKWIVKPIPSQTGTFSQLGFPSVSQLTITPDAS